MPGPKVYFNSLAWLPADWSQTAGYDGERRVNAALLVIAHVKRDISALLTDRKLGQVLADNLAADLRVQRPPYADKSPLGMGLIDPAQVGVYIWYQAAKNNPIIRVELDGSFTTLGHFRHDPARGLYVEPATPESETP